MAFTLVADWMSYYLRVVRKRSNAVDTWYSSEDTKVLKSLEIIFLSSKCFCDMSFCIRIIVSTTTDLDRGFTILLSNFCLRIEFDR